MSFLYKLLILMLLQFLTTAMQAQKCAFDYYHKKGGHYLFSTYYEVDMMTKKEGVCEMQINGKNYEKRLFKDGLLILENLNYFEGGRRISTTMSHSGDRNGILGKTEEYSEDTKLHKSQIFYLDKSKRRCMEIKEFYQNGELRSVQHYAFIRLSEIDSYQIKNYPDHTIDRFGYTWLSVPFGKHKFFHENGNIARIETYKMSYSDYEAKQSLHGAYIEYYPSGKPYRIGTYKNGNQDSLWLILHANGRIMERGVFRNNLQFGLWERFDESGIKIGELFYDPNSADPFKPIWEKKWNKSGSLLEHKELDKNGSGFLRVWNDHGLLIREAEYKRTGSHNIHEPLTETRWYDNGQLYFRRDNRPKTDTTYVSYFNNTKLEQLNLRFNKADTFFEINKSWNDKGFLIRDNETIHRPGFARQSLKYFHENGNPFWTFTLQDNLQKEEYFALNGVKIKSFSSINGKLQGEYQVFDSLGNKLIAYYYKDGLRDGTCRRYNTAAAIVFEANYKNGCPINKSVLEAKERPVDELEILKKMANYQLLTNANTEGYPMNYSLDSRDSLSNVYGFLFDAIKENGIEKKFDTALIPALKFYLPEQIFKGLENKDLNNPYILKLKNAFDSLNWDMPTFTLEKTVYRVDLTLNELIGYRFIQKHFGDIALYIQGPSQLKINDFDKFYCSDNIARISDCYWRTELCLEKINRIYKLLIYSDSEIEFENQSADWKDILNEKTQSGNYYWKNRD